MTVSKYFREQDMATVAKNLANAPIKRRRNRTPRGFSIYTYRTKKFLFTYKDNMAKVSMLDDRTNEPVANVEVPKERAYIAARALVRILEAERVLSELEKKN